MSYISGTNMDYDLIMARNEIARHGVADPVAYAKRRWQELRAKPWRKNNGDWRGRVEAFKLIATEKVSYEICRDP